MEISELQAKVKKYRDENYGRGKFTWPENIKGEIRNFHQSGHSINSLSKSLRILGQVNISKALWECLVDNDTEGFKEILRAHLELINKDDFAKEAGISRRTLFRMLSEEGNPTLDNISKIINKLCA